MSKSMQKRLAISQCETCVRLQKIWGDRHIHAAEEPHTCPYREDIHNDSETLCNCCEDCTQSCAEDI